MNQPERVAALLAGRVLDPDATDEQIRSLVDSASPETVGIALRAVVEVGAAYGREHPEFADYLRRMSMLMQLEVEFDE